MAGRGALTGEAETKPDNRRRQANRVSFQAAASYGRAREAIGRDKPGGPISYSIGIANVYLDEGRAVDRGLPRRPPSVAPRTVRDVTPSVDQVRGEPNPDGSRSDTSCG